MNNSIPFSDEALEGTLEQLAQMQDMAKALKLPYKDYRVLQFLIVLTSNNEGMLVDKNQANFTDQNRERLADSEGN